MRNRTAFLPLLALLALPLLAPAGAGAKRHKAEVLYVVDGDTLKVIHEGKKISVRLIGIDTPESRMNKRAKLQARNSGSGTRAVVEMGKRAKKFVKGLVGKGDTVGIEFDVEKHDRYRRLLGYVYLGDGRMLNEVIIRSGYAEPLTIPPNVKYQKRFLKGYRYARERRLGLWE